MAHPGTDPNAAKPQTDPNVGGTDPGQIQSSGPRNLPAIGRYGDYEIIGRLTVGGMAEILLGREVSEGAGARELIVKRILPEYSRDKAFVDMFLDEARVMMQLEHPNVCHVYKFGTQDGTHFIAMEWVNGGSLGKVIRRARKVGGLPIPIACKVISMVAEALDSAHQATNEHDEPLGIVHRDVTPDNIMISYDGAVKLLDFGIAKADSRATKTQAGVVKGKFSYMAPEQCRAKDLDHRVDIFALGVCLYEALTGRPLYRRETEFQTMEAIVRGPVPTLSERMEDPPPELEQIIARCLAKKRSQRFDTAGDLAAALIGFTARQGKVVTGRTLKDMMGKLFKEEKARGPMIDTTPFGSSFHLDSAADADKFPDASAPGLPVPNIEPPTGQMPSIVDVPVPNIEPVTTVPTVSEPAPRPAPEVGIIDMSIGVDAAPGPALFDGQGARRHHLSRDRRPVPTAPTHVSRPATTDGGGVWKWVAIVTLAVGAVGAALFFGRQFLMDPVEVAPENTGPAEILTGTLDFNTDPAGAILFVDGDRIPGETPVVVRNLRTGAHRVRVEMDGYEVHQGTLEIRSNQTREVNQPLDALPVRDGPPGTINLSTNPRAEVFFRGLSLGRTPLRGLELPSGYQALEFEVGDGTRIRRGVLISEGETTSTSIDLMD